METFLVEYNIFSDIALSIEIVKFDFFSRYNKKTLHGLSQKAKFAWPGTPKKEHEFVMFWAQIFVCTRPEIFAFS